MKAYWLDAGQKGNILDIDNHVLADRVVLDSEVEE